MYVVRLSYLTDVGVRNFDTNPPRPTVAGINKTMKELCVSLPKWFPSVLGMHTEIWKLHRVSWQLLYYYSVYIG